MADKRLKILGSDLIANGTRAFHLDRPNGFEYEAGQTIDLTLIEPKDMDAEGPVRTFSLVSAPHEPELEFATRMRDTAFKRTIGSAPAGTELSWDGPYGSFTLHKNASKPAVFLAGGIGITPFMSIVKDALHKRLQHQLFLFHSNNTPEDAPFLDTLMALDHSDPNFHYVPTMTAMEKSEQKWHGDHGFITKDMIERHVIDLATPIFYLAGPPGFVSAMRKMLAEAGADEDNVRFEEFPGY
ncbi:MAG: FAD-dependent oxidoreductase [Bacteroidota bacterium]|nr:FAD-dependent oxidoreductase [Bacteroidota bacterium]MDP4234455.1 FAD-dependent oxidoreductase [Bacteroidota bacterium]MDP4243963.1 FAD-dependent oxidoreductase [Bacteroidota bacterium]MDP4288187.1 FAD-dependent oxidoreductase [Bacteroidota bacterium]